MVMRNVTISIPIELYNKAKHERINVSFASTLGIRVQLGLSCPIEGGCKCELKSARLQALLLSAQDDVNRLEEEYQQLKLYARKAIKNHVQLIEEDE